MSELTDGYTATDVAGNIFVFDESRSPSLQLNLEIKAQVGNYPAEAAAAVAAGVQAVRESLEASFPGVTAQGSPTVLIGVRQVN
ncbi:hypothetical protein [Streptomyces sp. NPDC055794]